MFSIVFDPMNLELVEFLEKDEKYNWRYVSPLVKKQVRSLSID